MDARAHIVRQVVLVDLVILRSVKLLQVIAGDVVAFTELIDSGEFTAEGVLRAF